MLNFSTNNYLTVAVPNKFLSPFKKRSMTVEIIHKSNFQSAGRLLLHGRDI